MWWKDRRQQNAKDRVSRAKVKEINRQRREAAAQARYDEQQARLARRLDQPLGSDAKFTIPAHPIHPNEVKLLESISSGVLPGYVVDPDKTHAGVKTRFSNRSELSTEWTESSRAVGPFEVKSGSGTSGSVVDMEFTHVGAAQVTAQHGEWKHQVIYTEAQRRERHGTQKRHTSHGSIGVGGFSLATSAEQVHGQMTETSEHSTFFKGTISTDGNRNKVGAVLDALEGTFVQIK